MPAGDERSVWENLVRGSARRSASGQECEETEHSCAMPFVGRSRRWAMWWHPIRDIGLHCGQRWRWPADHHTAGGRDNLCDGETMAAMGPAGARKLGSGGRLFVGAYCIANKRKPATASGITAFPQSPLPKPLEPSVSFLFRLQFVLFSANPAHDSALYSLCVRF